MDKNSRPLGDVLQSMSLIGSNLYCVVNASNKIEVVDAKDFSELGAIEGLDNPRYAVGAYGKLFVSEWGNGGQVKMIDPITFIVEGTIAVGTGPEGIMVHNNLIWVANGGGFTVDSTISVIDPSTNTVIENIVVGYNPKEMTVDANGEIWVICNGYVEYDANWNIAGQKPSKLVKISAQNLEVLKEILISETLHPQHIDISPDRKTIYYGGGYGFAGIHSMHYANETNTQIIAADKYFYGFNVNPDNGDIYGLEAPSFTENGQLYRYNASGEFVKGYEVGIGPNSVVFW